MNILNLKTGEPFDESPRMHHRELAVEGASSATSRTRNLLGLRGAMMVGGKKLPYDYAVEYLASDGRQYTNTGISVSADDEVDVVAEWLGGSIGAVVGAASWGMQCTTYGGYLTVMVTKAKFVLFSQTETRKFNLTYTNNICDLDGSSVSPIGDNNSIVSGSLYNLFRSHVGGLSTAHIYEFRVAKNGENVIDLTPCVKDGIPCFYDEVSGDFLGDANGVGYTAGPKV